MTQRRRLPSEERRREFIDQAVAFFAEEGVESSTRELARRLGVTQPLLYRYFPSKDDLIEEVYRAVYMDRWRPEWDALITDRTGPLADRLVAFYEAYTDTIFERDWLRIYLFSGLKGTAINRNYLAFVDARILKPIIAEARGTDPTDEDLELAWIMHGGIFYFGVRAQVFGVGDIRRKPQVIRAAVESFLAAIRQP